MAGSVRPMRVSRTLHAEDRYSIMGGRSCPMVLANRVPLSSLPLASESRADNGGMSAIGVRQHLNSPTCNPVAAEDKNIL